ncbi:cytochrome P450 [Pisolithus orientalis]|uniref:cytochrome P450 n=1 Tax=Pisolithus orientalis TaxID=936130 RepID=UPI0022253ACF|nr:cytochrome P450 [Pisolithus orientalis]KAI6028871.1 cytochrome P450 [Pisolithus orientalis]
MDFLFTPYLVAGICAALVVACSFRLLRCSNLDHIPVVGHSSLLASYWFTKGLEVDHTERFVQEGYNKYKSGIFRVANLTHWVVCLHRSHLEHAARALEDHLSFIEAADNSLKLEHTFGLKNNDMYHVSIIQSTLTRSLSVLYADVRDEIVAACNEYLDLKHNEWKTISAVRVTLKIASRASNRMFVGLPLCRDPDWLDLNMNLPRAVVDEARILRLFPSFMVPLVAKFVTNLSGRTSRGVALLGPVIKERLQHMEAEGTDWNNKPNDFLQWCMDSKQETSLTSLTRRIISINFAGIHTTSSALFHLAENPRHAQALRDEVEVVVSKYGWTKEGLSKMRKVDSFLKETQRFEGLSILGLSRKAMSDITLADGTFIPQGTFLAFPAHAMHHDDAVYENPNVFEPFRFADMRNKEFEGSRHQMVAITPDLLSFGLGRHTCPGRFFAATVLKTMLAHIVMSYDVKRGNDESRPTTLHVGRAIVPNPTAKVMFRKREE